MQHRCNNVTLLRNNVTLFILYSVSFLAVWPDTLSKIIESKKLLYQIHDCCSADYNNSNFETSYNELFSCSIKQVVLSPEKLEQVNLMLLYNTLRDFVNECRNTNIEKVTNYDI